MSASGRDALLTALAPHRHARSPPCCARCTEKAPKAKVLVVGYPQIVVARRHLPRAPAGPRRLRVRREGQPRPHRDAPQGRRRPPERRTSTSGRPARATTSAPTTPGSTARSTTRSRPPATTPSPTSRPPWPTWWWRRSRPPADRELFSTALPSAAIVCRALTLFGHRTMEVAQSPSGITLHGDAGQPKLNSLPIGSSGRVHHASRCRQQRRRGVPARRQAAPPCPTSIG